MEKHLGLSHHGLARHSTFTAAGWPDAVRDDVLARLLALNPDCYVEEVRLGLHSKDASKASGTSAAGGKHRGRPAKAADSADTEQIGLAL